jgi:hypothetical protein
LVLCRAFGEEEGVGLETPGRRILLPHCMNLSYNRTEIININTILDICISFRRRIIKFMNHVVIIRGDFLYNEVGDNPPQLEIKRFIIPLSVFPGTIFLRENYTKSSNLNHWRITVGCDGGMKLPAEICNMNGAMLPLKLTH